MAKNKTAAETTLSPAEKNLLQKEFQQLLDAYKVKPDDARPPHISELSRDQLKEISLKAAAIIKTSAPSLLAPIEEIAGAKGKHALLVHNLPFETKGIPRPAEPIIQTSRWANNGDDGAAAGNAGYYHERGSILSDFFTLGVQQIIVEKNGYSFDEMHHAEVTNTTFDGDPDGQQAFHRDKWKFETRKPRYSTLSCQEGHNKAFTHLLDESTAIASLKDEARTILSDPKRFTLNGKSRGVLETIGGALHLAPSDDHSPIWPDHFMGVGFAASQAKRTLLKALETNEEKVALLKGDFLLFDQEFMLHRAGKKDKTIDRHISNITCSVGTGGTSNFR